MKINYDKLVKEWSNRMSGRAPIYTNRYHKSVLREVMKDFGYPLELLGEGYIEKSVKNKIDKKSITEFYIRVGEILSEATIDKDKYKFGHKVTWSKGGESSFKKKLPAGKPMLKMPAEKTNETADAIDVFQKVDGPIEYWLKDSNNNYHLQGTQSGLSSWFNHYSDNKEFKLDTAGKESAALLGLYMDAKGYLDRFNKLDDTTADEGVPGLSKEFKSEVKKTFSNGKDWTSHSIVGKLSTASLGNLIQIAAIASGLQEFCKDKGCLGWNMIHGDIQKYYDAEKNNPHIVTEGGKDNTADCIIVDSATSTFLKNMESEVVDTSASDGLCVLATGEKFYQVSLKEAEGGAQLGKITADFAAKFGVVDNAALASSFITEDFEPELLDEGLRDLYNKGKEFIKGVGAKIIATISTISKKVTGFYKQIFGKFDSAKKKADKKSDKFVIGLASKYLKEGKLNEAKKMSVNRAIEIIAANPIAQKNLYNEINSKLKLLINTCKKIDGVRYSDASGYGLKTIPYQSQDVNGVRKLIMNIRAFDALYIILKSSSGTIRTASEIFDELIDLEKDMYFGRTSLPLYKVYGLDSAGSGTAYVFLNTGKEYAAKRKDATKDGFPKFVMVIYVSVNAPKGKSKGYGTIGTYMLSEIKETEPYYNQVGFRSNASDAFTFTIEGSSIISKSELVKKNHIPADKK
tara:strand:- start:673 stop:2736 length:2064 start_codon:yes stop_codon:yes gene_type:complete